VQGQLFSSDFLLRGIQETDAWRGLTDTDLDAFIDRLRAHYAPFRADSTLNEAQTEDELIEPVIDLLGWNDAWISQVNLSETGHEDVPDFLLFAEPTAKDRALQASDDGRARYGVALLEALAAPARPGRGVDPGGQPQAPRLRRAVLPDVALPVPRRRHERLRGEMGHPHQWRDLAVVLAGCPLAP